MGAVEIMAATAIAIGDLGSQLRAIQQRVCAVTDTRWVVIVSIIVGKGTPFGSSIDNTIANNEATRTTDQIAGGELLNKIWWKLFTVFTYCGHVQVLAPFCDALLSQGLLHKRLWGHHLRLVWLWPIDVIKFVEDRALRLALPGFLPLARYKGACLCIQNGFLVEKLGGNLDKKFGMQFGGIARTWRTR